MIQSRELLFLTLYFLLIILSIILFEKKRNYSLFLLFLATLILGWHTASLDPFLNVWDEQYHALVAKNMVENPFEPRLFDEHVLPFDKNNWTYNSIWLHKQPLFLWQMALSIKLFGLSALSVRLPSVLLFSLMPLMVFRIGKITVNKNIGFLAAILMSASPFVLELLSGFNSTDHNDVSFLFYVLASFWSFWEYRRTGNTKWLILVGIFSGAAVLVKWLMGLLIFPTWFLSNQFSNPEGRFSIRSYLPILIAFSIALMVFMPWQIYIHNYFPEEAAYEMDKTSRHLIEVVEGHYEDRFYYFNEGLSNFYGRGALVPFALLLGLIMLFVHLKDHFKRYQFLFSIAIVYSVYTIAETKMPAFPVIVIWIGYLALASIIYGFYTIVKCWLTNQVVLRVVSFHLLILTVYLSLDYNRINENHFGQQDWAKEQRAQNEMEIRRIQQLDRILGKDRHFVFNANLTYAGYIPVMFYTNHIAYDIIPTEDQLISAISSGRNIAIIDKGGLPEYLDNYTTVRQITISELDK